jgi:amino acid permease
VGCTVVLVFVPYGKSSSASLFRASANQCSQVFLFPVLFIGWKVLKKTKFVSLHEMDLETDLKEIEEYHRTYVEKPETNMFNRALDKLFG